MFFTGNDLYDPELIGAAFLAGWLLADAIFNFIEDGEFIEFDCD